MNTRSIKQRLLASVLALLMAMTAMVGTTFAWFTDSVTSAGNKIVAGNLAIDLVHLTKEGEVSLKQTPDHKIFDYDKWEPGYTRAEALQVRNLGSLALKYQLSVEVAEGTAELGDNGENLADVIDVYVIFGDYTAASFEDLKAKAEYKGTLSAVMAKPAEFIGGQLLPNGKTLDGTEAATVAVGKQTVTVALHMQESAGNAYQKLSVGDVYVNLIATQWNDEEDSFGNDYDEGVKFPNMEDADLEMTVPVENGAVKEDTTVTQDGMTMTAPAGTKTTGDKLTLSVKTKNTSSTNLTLGDSEIMLPLDVHVEGLAQDNEKPVVINLGEKLPKGLNIGNYTLYHVENGANVAMTAVDSVAELDVHNEFYYDPATGEVTVAMKSFSEVALVADTVNAWEGKFDYTWYDASKTELTIANADQLAAFGAIVGGMAKDKDGNFLITYKDSDGDEHHNDSFSGKTVKLLADINLGDKESENNPDLIFYPIGYNSSDGKYEKTGEAVTTGFYNFSGIFDGNGNTIANFYQNTWEMKGDNNYYAATLQYYRDGMGLFGKLYGGTVKNLTVSNFSSDGEYTTTGVIAAYADGATFENIAITNCNPRVYNIGNGGIVGCVGWYAKEADLKSTFENITVDNSNKISALWGSYDVACGGLVGQYYPTSGQSSAGTPKNGGVDFVNCHVSAQMDVYNDVCGNYQYYAYRYAGMIIGSIRENTTNEDGKTIPDMTGISATGCTVNYGDWNDYYYCEFEKNGHPSYSGPTDYKFSRVPHSELEFTDSNGNGVVDADERASVTGCKHNHTDAENNKAIYLPFHQLFTGYGWGVSSIGLEKYSGIVTNLDITEGDQEESVVKFETKFTGDFLYRVGNQNAVSIGSLFAAKNGATISNAGVWVKVESVDKNVKVDGTFTADTTDWTKGTIQFSGTGVVKVTIQDYNFCKPTELLLEVVDAVNATGAMSATENNVVLLNDCGLSSMTVSGRYAFYGNGFTMTYTDNGQYLNNGLKLGVVTVAGNGVLDNVRIIASIYPKAYLYYSQTSLGDYVQGGPYSTEGDKVRYHYQLSAVALSGNGTISNCYIYGGRTNVIVNDGNATVKDTVLECGTVANMQIQSRKDYTVTLENLTTIQYQVEATIGDTSKVMVGAGILVGPETSDNPTIVLNGEFKQYNWVTKEDADAVSSGSVTEKIINGALDASDYNHTINGKKASNLGIIYINNADVVVQNNTGLPYEEGTVAISALGTQVNGKVYSLKNASADQIYSDYEKADRTTENGLYRPQFKYDDDLGNQMIPDEGGDEFLYRDGDTIKVMFPNGATKELDLAVLVNVAKYSGQDLNLQIKGDGVTDGKITLSAAGEYVITYTVTDTLFYDKDGETYSRTIEYSWDVTINVFVKDTKISDAYFEFDADKQKMGYYAPSYGDIRQYIPFLAGLKIYDYNGKDAYLRFDGDNDFGKVASVTITEYQDTNDDGKSDLVFIEVKLTDGGVINTRFLPRANSGGDGKYVGSIKTRDNTIYYVPNNGTGNKESTTTAAYWYVDYYKFIGNNGVEITSAKQTFNSIGSSASIPSDDFRTSIKYTVTYDANGGNCGQNTGYATSVSEVVTLPTPSKSGYIFVGWYTAVSGGTRVGGAGDSYTPSANITLYAQWGKPCTVTYNANGGTCGTTSEKYSGKALTLPTPTRDGYWFIGWYDAAEGGNMIGDAGAAYNPKDEITLYAHWQEAIKYTVTYNANGGSCGTASATYEGTALTLPAPTKEGHTFNGWYTAASGGTKIGDAGASYIPSANITLYAQWTIDSYTITVTTSYATVKVNGTQVSNNGTVSIQYNATVSIEVAFNKTDDKTLTVTNKSTSKAILSKNEAGTYTFTMPASDVTISASSSCVTGDTLVTLADGTQARVDSLVAGDMLLVWNMETGKFDVAPIMFNDSEAEAEFEVIKLYFSDGTEVKVISEHGFWDYDLNKYVYLDRYADKYIGHTFAKQNGDSLEKVTLVDVVIETEVTTAWSPVTAGHLCYFVNGMLSMPGGVGGLFNIFEVDPETMTYDFEQMAKDIETYGLFTYEELNAICPLSEDMFNAAGGAYLKISIGKGNLTIDELIYMINRYSKFI